MTEQAESITQREAARRLEVTVDWISKLTKRGVLSRNADKSYPWPRIREDYAAFKAETARVEETPDYKAELARLTKLKADAQQLENDVAAGLYKAVAESEAEVRAVLRECDLVLRGSPRRLAKKWARRLKRKETEVIELVEQMVEDVRTLLREAAGGDHANAA